MQCVLNPHAHTKPSLKHAKTIGELLDVFDSFLTLLHGFGSGRLSVDFPRQHGRQIRRVQHIVDGHAKLDTFGKRFWQGKCHILIHTLTLSHPFHPSRTPHPFSDLLREHQYWWQPHQAQQSHSGLAPGIGFQGQLGQHHHHLNLYHFRLALPLRGPLSPLCLESFQGERPSACRGSRSIHQPLQPYTAGCRSKGKAGWGT